MKTLVVATTFSKTFVAVVTDLLHAEVGKATFVTTRPDTLGALKSIGASPIFLESYLKETQSQKDKQFAEVAMPGPLKDFYPMTELPLWKSLAMDRLSFWYRGVAAKHIAEMIKSFDHNRTVVSLDLETPLPWAIAMDQNNVIAVQCGSILTRAYADLAPFLPFSIIVVRDERSRNFLVKFGFPPERLVVLDVGDVPTPSSKLEQAQKNEILTGLGIAENTKLTVVPYEAQTEWAMRRWLHKTNTTNQIVFLIQDPFERKQLHNLFGEVLVVDDPNILGVADEIVMFRYSEHISRTYLHIPIRVMDVANRFQSGSIV